MHWWDQAACLDIDPELFFPLGRSPQARRQTEEAKAVCRRCPVIKECLQCALDTHQEFGVWGGMSDEERRNIRRSRQGRRHIDYWISPETATAGEDAYPALGTRLDIDWRGATQQLGIEGPEG